MKRTLATFKQKKKRKIKFFVQMITSDDGKA